VGSFNASVDSSFAPSSKIFLVLMFEHFFLANKGGESRGNVLPGGGFATIPMLRLPAVKERAVADIARQAGAEMNVAPGTGAFDCKGLANSGNALVGIVHAIRN